MFDNAIYVFKIDINRVIRQFLEVEDVSRSMSQSSGRRGDFAITGLSKDLATNI